jgi:rsbT co-antagonist protein RsbR
MSKEFATQIPKILETHKDSILSSWMKEQLNALTLRKDLLSEEELMQQSEQFIRLFQIAVQSASLVNIYSQGWEATKEFLRELSYSRAQKGFQPSETATFVFSLKQPLFVELKKEYADNPAAMLEEIWAVTVLLDKLGLLTTEIHQKAREDLIKRQQEEMLELSTPVVKLWEGILALPMIGTLDSNRTQIVMESLLQKIVETSCEVAIVDITGVPNVDTLVAQHLLKTVTAARLMGADCIISGISPQIAQTIVHLGVELAGIVTKASLADALREALRLTDRSFSARGSKS